MNLRPGPDRWPFTLEKWYVDTLLEDGAVLLVYLARMRLFGAVLARVTAELFRPGCAPLRGSAKVSRIGGGEDRLDFGAASIDGPVLRIETAGLVGTLRFAPRYGPAALGAPFLRSGDRRLDWTVEIPDADVSGMLRWPGGDLSVRGRGYRDRVWLDLLPWRFPIRELRWGRIAAGPHASTWAAAETPGGPLAAGWADGAAGAGEPPPDALGELRVLVAAPVLMLPGLRLGALGAALRRLGGDPQEVKWSAAARFRGATGWALREQVRWT